jgi:hypothetical protein
VRAARGGCYRRPMSRVWLSMLALAFASGAGEARADDIGPGDEERRRECTVPHQESAGATCIPCTVNAADGERICQGSVDGMTMRCAVGATHQVQIWCTGPAPASASIDSQPPGVVWAAIGACCCMSAVLAGGAGLFVMRRKKR